MRKLVVLDFPDDWKKGQCDKCPYKKTEAGVTGCIFGKLKNGWCQLLIKPDKCIENAFERGYDAGYKEGRRVNW